MKLTPSKGKRSPMSTTPNAQPKLHAYLAKIGYGSRREIESWILAKRIQVNGVLATIGQRINPEKDTIQVDGKPVTTATDATEHVYFLIDKPRNVVTTTDDELGRRTVLSLLPRQNHRIYPVGRLDQDSEGLLLLTNDGDLAYKLTHPKFTIHKTYEVLLDRPISYQALQFLRKGVKLKDGFSKPDSVEKMDLEPEKQWLEITIHEGKNHHIRRMIERSGYDVKRLIRTKLGPFTLDDLDGETWKQLSAEQVHELVQTAGNAASSLRARY